MFEQFHINDNQSKINHEFLKRIERIEKFLNIIPGDKESYSLDDTLPLNVEIK